MESKQTQTLCTDKDKSNLPLKKETKPKKPFLDFPTIIVFILIIVFLVATAIPFIF